MKSFIVAITLFLLQHEVKAWSSPLSRRETIQKSIQIGTAAFLPLSVSAMPSEETPRVVTRMGGLLEPFQDGLRSIRMMAPSGTLG